MDAYYRSSPYYVLIAKWLEESLPTLIKKISFTNVKNIYLSLFDEGKINSFVTH